MDSAGGGGGGAVPWRRQGSGGGSVPSSPGPPPPPPMTVTGGESGPQQPPPPPPPPMMGAAGSLPAVRLSSEIGPRENKGPPMALAGAMMKDKKPFTYTPGGIDLSEIRSPRMAKRIQMNAAAEGVTSVPTHSNPGQGTSPGYPGPGASPYLPPAAMAAMNSAMAIPVLPQGGFNASNMNRAQRPTDFVRQEHEGLPQHQPSLPMQLQQQIQQAHQMRSQQGAAPAPPPSHFSEPSQPPPPPPSAQQQQQTLSTSQGHQMNASRRSPSPGRTTGTGSIYIAPLTSSSSSTPTPSAGGNPQPFSPSSFNLQQHGPSGSPIHFARQPQQEQQQQQRPGLTKAQAQSQHLGSIYIPPIEQRPSVFGDRSGGASTGTPGTASTPATFSPTPTSSSESSTPRTPQTPQLNKAPTPWMSSYGRNQNQQQPPPPTPPQSVMSPGQNVTPWGRSVGRTIPIAMARADSSDDSEGGRGGGFSSGRPQWLGPDAQGRVIPIQIQRDGGDNFTPAGGARQIPIQVEGKRGPGFGIPASQQQQQQQDPQSLSRGSAYNSPLSAYPNNSSQTSRDSQARQAAAELGTDLETLNVRNDEDNYRSEPIQSKSFKVIQRIAEDGELVAAGFKERQTTTAGERKLLLTDDDKTLMDNIKAQVDEGSSLHKTAEPRFRGGHIPSRAFRVLQSNLPPSPGVGGQDFAPSYPVQTGSGPTVHTIPIRLASSQVTQTSSSAMGSSTSTHQSESRSRAEGVSSTGSSSTDEQGVEPKKYMGGNIPSRSFKILQAMTGGEEEGSPRTTTWTDGADERENIKKLTKRPPRPPCRSLSSTPTPMSSQNQSNNNNNNNSSSSSINNQNSTTTTNPGKFVRSRTVSPSPTPRSVNCTCNCTCNMTNNNYSNNNNPHYSSNSSSYLGSESESEDYAANTPTSPSYSPWPEQQSVDGTKYDPNYAYLQWYYWWYYNYPAYAMAWNNQPYENMDPNAQENYYQYNNYYDQDPRRMSPYGYYPAGYHHQGQRGKSEGRSQENQRGGQRDFRREASAPPPEVPKIVIERDSPKRPSSVHLLHPNNNYYGNDFNSFATKTERVETDDSQAAGHEDEMRNGYEMEEEEWKNKESDSLARNPCDSDWKSWEKSGQETDYKQESDIEDCVEYVNNSHADDKVPAQIMRDELLNNETVSSFNPLQKPYRSLSDTNLASNSKDIYDEQDVVVEEPETPSISSVMDDDAPTLVDDSQAIYNSGVIIEECYSPECEMEEPYEESPAERRVTSRLSTIEEMTEQSRTTNVDQLDQEWRDDTVNEVSDEEEDISTDDDDEGSSVSVIENRSEVNNDWGGGTTTGGESHADEASTCSSSSDAADENDDDPLLPTVTVQLPLKLSFSKSSSNQDITTLSVGKSQIQEDDFTTVDSAESDLDEDADRPATQISLQRQDEDDEEPVVSYTISLSPSRSTSKSRQDSDQEGEDDLEMDKESKGTEHVSEEVDFWSQIQSEEEPTNEEREETEWKKEARGRFEKDTSEDRDFWSELSETESRNERASETTRDFWEDVSSRKTESETEKVNFWDRSPAYETRRLNRQFSWEVDPVTEQIIQNQISQSNAESDKFETKPDDAPGDFARPALEDAQPAEPAPKLNSTVSDTFTFKTTEEKLKERRESVTRNVETTMKVDTIFSNRKLDNCDFSGIQQQSGTNTTSQRKTKSSSHRGKSSWKGEALTYVSDENSDESCSTTVADSSGGGRGGVITGTDSEAAAGNKQQRSERLASNNNNSYEYRRTSTSTKTELTEKNVEVRETLEKLRLGPELCKDSSSSGESDENFFKSDNNNKKERKLERMAKAEDLLWRIERFLQESLSLGSEDDSGVMTDQSRQISDADTDNDVDTEVVTLRQNTTTSRSQRTLKTRSLIETRSSSNKSNSELTGYENVDTSNVILRRTNSNNAEKKSLRYQRAKTHSRLFQLLQDECSKSEEDISTMEMIDFENLEQVEAAIEKENKRKSNCHSAGREGGRRVRSLCSEASLLGSLPANNNNDNKSLLGSDSTSSSSGVLSPSSPAGRDQLLADIINEFHQRHQSQTRKKVENFPSKIFKLLQQEFGEEFYDTFDCCQDDFDDLPVTLNSLSKLLNPQNNCSSSPSATSEIKNRNHDDHVDPPAQEENTSGKAGITAISSIEEAVEEEEQSTTKSSGKNSSSSHRSSTSSKIEFLEVPVRRKKSHLLNRDPRIPKTKKSHA